MASGLVCLLYNGNLVVDFVEEVCGGYLRSLPSLWDYLGGDLITSFHDQKFLEGGDLITSFHGRNIW